MSILRSVLTQYRAVYVEFQQPARGKVYGTHNRKIIKAATLQSHLKSGCPEIQA